MNESLGIEAIIRLSSLGTIQASLVAATTAAAIYSHLCQCLTSIMFYGAQDPSIEEKQAAFFGVTCVHAGFGDVELAQLSLRGTHVGTHSGSCAGTWRTLIELQ